MRIAIALMILMCAAGCARTPVVLSGYSQEQMDRSMKQTDEALKAFAEMKEANDKNVKNIRDLLEVNRRNERTIDSLQHSLLRCTGSLGQLGGLAESNNYLR